MKAIVQDRYGVPEEVLRFVDVDGPVVGDKEVLVRVRAASVHADVWHVVTGRPWILRLMGAGLRRPKNPVPGTDLAGVVEAVGKDVTRFAPGDEVFGESHPKMQWVNGGAFAEFASAPQDALARKPASVTFEEAASVPTSGIIALINVPSADQIGPGQSVLINGVAGGVGSTKKLDLLRSIGADQVIDYTQEDFTLRDERYDLIVDVASTLSLAEAKSTLAPYG